MWCDMCDLNTDTYLTLQFNRVTVLNNKSEFKIEPYAHLIVHYNAAFRSSVSRLRTENVGLSNSSLRTVLAPTVSQVPTLHFLLNAVFLILCVSRFSNYTILKHFSFHTLYYDFLIFHSHDTFINILEKCRLHTATRAHKNR